MTRPPRGFTLTELLMAIILLAIAILGTASVVATTSTTQTLSATRGEMAMLASSKLEAFRIGLEAGDVAVITALQEGGNLAASVPGFSDAVTGANGMAFVRRWQVAPGPALSHRVTMRVLPQAVSARTPPSVDIVTYLLVP